MKIRLSDLTTVQHPAKPDRRGFIGGSDARIIMSPDEAALIRLWKEKRGEAAPEDLSGNLIVQLGVATEALPWSFSEEAAVEKHMAQLQHNMWVTNAQSAALSIITGGGKWIEMTIPADALYQHFLVTAERRFWRCGSDWGNSKALWD